MLVRVLALSIALTSPVAAQLVQREGGLCLPKVQATINGVHLLATAASVKSLLGPPVRSDSTRRIDDGGEFLARIWAYPDITVLLGRDGLVQEVSTTSPKARLPLALRIGQTLPEVAELIALPDTAVAAYGAPLPIFICWDSPENTVDAGVLLKFEPVYGPFDPPSKRSEKPRLTSFDVSLWGE